MTPINIVNKLLETDDDYPSFLQPVPDPDAINREGSAKRAKDKKQAAGRNSVTMSRNRNLRRKAFGYPDYRYSVKDRGWPT